MNFASVNGTIVPAEEARVSVLDNGFAFGDSVYEVMRTYDGLVFEPGRHFRRLRGSAARLGIEVTATDAELLGQVRGAPRPRRRRRVLRADHRVARSRGLLVRLHAHRGLRPW